MPCPYVCKIHQPHTAHLGFIFHQHFQKQSCAGLRDKFHPEELLWEIGRSNPSPTISADKSQMRKYHIPRVWFCLSCITRPKQAIRNMIKKRLNFALYAPFMQKKDPTPLKPFYKPLYTTKGSRWHCLLPRGSQVSSVCLPLPPHRVTIGPPSPSSGSAPRPLTEPYSCTSSASSLFRHNKKTNTLTVHIWRVKASVEVSEDQPNKNRQRLFIQSSLQQWSRHHYLSLAETQKQAGEWKSFMVDKRKGFRGALIGGCWPGDTRDGLAKSRAANVVG